jgi:hypothetical protein
LFLPSLSPNFAADGSGPADQNPYFAFLIFIFALSYDLIHPHQRPLRDSHADPRPIVNIDSNISIEYR